jgi:ATP-dependent DNA helicase RecG
MAEMTRQAGLPLPEIEEAGGCVTVRFRPSRYLPPQRIPHDLTAQQQEILRILGSGQRIALRELRGALAPAVNLRGLKEDLAFLKRLRLISSTGHGRGARWFLQGQSS